MGKLKIAVNKARCVGSGDCIETAPAVFQLDEAGKSEVIDPAAVPDAVILTAARGCPVKAITVTDEEAGIQIFPPPPKK